jgi:hypothetical protein
MAGLAPAIHVLNARGKKGVDARDKPGGPMTSFPGIIGGMGGVRGE